MRVALLNDSFPPQVDGVVNAVVNYAAVLSARGHDVTVAVPSNPDAVDDYSFPVIRYQSLDTTKMFGYRAGNPLSLNAVQSLAAFAPDIVHSHCPIVSTLLARTLRETTPAPLVFTYHTKFDIDIRAAIHGKLIQDRLITALVRNVEACDEVWTVSRGAGENLRSIGFKGEYHVMENGVDMPRGRASDGDIARVNDMFGLAGSMPVFLFAGRLRWYKGIRLIVEGLAKAMRAGESFRMVFVGDGTDRQEIEALCRETGIMPLCVFTGLLKDRELLRALYSRADLFLFPSAFDTNGIVVREAAACGLGALLLEGSCAAEGVTDGVNGLFMQADADSLAQKVLYICRHPEEARRIGQNAQDQLYLSWDTAVSRAEARYRDVIKRHADFPPKPRRDLFPFVSDCVEAVIKLKEIEKLIVDMIR
ncbi:MAG: glycosyltransferase [Clostridia bacterium]|nr:glycosyltransferase [Clostridia bacterium]